MNKQQLNFSRATTVTIENSKFLNNNFIGGNGGAIRASHETNITIINSVFENNFAQQGGAIYANKLSLISCIFTGNTANLGGAIYLYPGSGLKMINDNIFGDNYALNSGGAIYVVNVTRSITISSSSFTNNNAPSGGAFQFSSLHASFFEVGIISQQRAVQLMFILQIYLPTYAIFHTTQLIIVL